MRSGRFTRWEREDGGYFSGVANAGAGALYVSE